VGIQREAGGNKDMALNEHEQKILDEIERQLYEDDPKLAEMVAKAVRSGGDRWKMRFAAVLFVLGAVVMFASFTQSLAIAAGGFLLMLASAGWMALTARSTRTHASPDVSDWVDRLQRRWRRDG
jgi:predicted phage tail protein